MSVREEMTLSSFKLWSTNALKAFLSARKKSVDGTFDELASRAFVAWEEGALEDLEAENKERLLKSEYQSKLVVEGSVIPDPFSMKSGWVGETAEGLAKWPPLYFHDIAEYLRSYSSDNLYDRLVNEYKEGKAYRYFSCGWVKEIYIHTIAPNSKYCTFKTKVTPSQRLSIKPYDVWAVVEKPNAGNPGGKIKSCYCSCIAGLHGSCNHIAGLLFRVEAAVMSGATVASCTSQPSKWNKPTAKSAAVSKPVNEIVFRKDHYRKLALNDPGKMAANHQKRKKYQPGSEHPFIGASADLDINCACCGAGHVEIKCPFSIKHTTPSEENLSYLERVGDKVTLKKNTNYYHQVQGQMAVSNRGYTDFFVFTLHGHILTRVKFDKQHWEMVLPKLIWFWEKYLCPEILTKRIADQLPADKENKYANSKVAPPPGLMRGIKKPGKNVVGKPGKAVKRKRNANPPVFLCGQCKGTISEKPQDYEEESVGCDLCPLWFHKTCVGLQENSTLPEKWYCKACNKNKQ